MRTHWATTPCLTVALALALGARATAGEDAPADQEGRDRTFVEAILAQPRTLEAALAETPEDAVAVAAAYHVEDDGRVRIEVLERARTDEHTYRVRVVGPAAGESETHSLDAPDAVARAATAGTLFSQADATLEEVGRKALRARDGDRRASRVLAIEPEATEDGVGFRCTVLVEGLPWTTHHRASGQLLRLERPPYLKEREDAAKRWVGRRLPDVDVEGGVWVNIERSPSLSDWRGSWVLLLLTDPG